MSAAIGPGVRTEDTGASSEDPVLILPRGQQLPFGTPRPLRIAVNKLGLDAKEATVNIQLFSSAGGKHRVALYDRVATFERGRWENLLKRFGTRLPWATVTLCSIGDELLNAIDTFPALAFSCLVS